MWHLLDGISRSHKLVTRTVFSSETLAAVAAADDLICMSLTLHEITHGPQAIATKRSLLHKPNSFTTILAVDTDSLYTALKAVSTRIPTEKGLTIYFHWLKE